MSSNGGQGGGPNADAGPRLAFFAVALVFAVTYAVLRFTYNVEGNSDLRALVEFRGAIPFALRILVPALARPFVDLGLPVYPVFFAFEAAFSFGLIVSLWALVRRLCENDEWARFASLAFPLLLAHTFLLNSIRPILNPYDTPAMLAIVLAIYVCLYAHWLWLVPLMLVATLNRESAILIAAIYAVLSAGDAGRRAYWMRLAALLGAYVLARAFVGHVASDNPRPYGSAVSFFVLGQWRFNMNIAFLLKDGGFFVFLGSLGLLPVAWLGLRDAIPAPLRRLAAVAIAYLGLLFFVGNYYEPRIFGEIVALIYVPVVVAMYRRLAPQRKAAPADDLAPSRASLVLVALIERTPLIVIGVTAVAAVLLNYLWPAVPGTLD